MPLLPLLGALARARADRAHDQDRADRLDRHGQVDRRRDVRARRRSGVRRRRRGPPAAGLGGVAGRRRSRGAFPGGDPRWRDRPRSACRARPCRSRRSSPRSRRSFIPRCSRRAKRFIADHARRAGLAVRHSLAVRNRRRKRVRQGHRRLRAGRRSSAQRVLARAGHDRGQARLDPRPPDARRRTSARAPTSSSTPAATYPQPQRQVRSTFSLVSASPREDNRSDAGNRLRYRNHRPQPGRRRPHGRDRLRRNLQPGRDRPPFPRLFQSRARHAGRGRGGARADRRSSCRTSRASPTRSRNCSNSSAIRRWSRTMPASISASSITSSSVAAGRRFA